MPTSDNEKPSAYARAGVDIDAKMEAICRMKQSLAATRISGVLTDAVGSFGGMFALKDAVGISTDPVLVSSIDGAGTKLKVAFLMDKHDTVGRDLVFHCVNDILVQGARPLFFLDYFGTGKLKPHVVVEAVRGLAEGCQATGCALIAGETAEMPGMYAEGEYDIAGCIVGVVDRSRIVTGESVVAGDILLGLGSDGIHTNGYSLARRVLLEEAGLSVHDTVPELGVTLGEALLWPHRCYANAILPILESEPGAIKTMAHITGGGFYDNIPRSLPAGLGATIRRGSWPIPPLFTLIQNLGGIEQSEMYRVFNMGVGFVLAVAADDADRISKLLTNAGERVYRIGEVSPTPGVVIG
jgi:phosphoribosylformylglycinamidine cyclo-ligase